MRDCNELRMNCWWAPYSDTLPDRPRSSHEHYHTFSSRMLYAVPHRQAAHQLLLSVSKRKKKGLCVCVYKFPFRNCPSIGFALLCIEREKETKF